MNHAKQHHTGYNSVTKQTEATTVTSAIRGIFNIAETPKKSSRNSKRQATSCTDNSTTNGFLRTLFLPKMQVNKEEKNRTKRVIKDIENGVYNSLSELEKHYQISTIPTRLFSYPYNIALAHWNIKQQLTKQISGNHFDEIQIVQQDNKTSLKVVEKCNTGRYLHYIPIAPLYHLYKQKGKRQTTNLLASVFCYLYRVAGVPFYREEESYLFWLYDMLEDWYEEEEHDDREAILTQLKEAIITGDDILRKIQSKEHITRWKYRIQSFNANDDFDKECHKISTQFFRLYETYENRHIYLNINRHNEDCFEDEYISIDKYISFIANTKNNVADQLFEIVNNEFSNYYEMEEPTIQKHFDGSKITTDNLDFENTFFPLVTKLCQLLN